MPKCWVPAQGARTAGSEILALPNPADDQMMSPENALGYVYVYMYIFALFFNVDFSAYSSTHIIAFYSLFS